MKHLFLIFIGGGTGSVVRYYLGKMVQGYFSSPFPFGTLGVNILACFILGIIAGIADTSLNVSAATKLLLITGFCGGLSTFSAFSYESVQLIQQERYFYLILYCSLSLFLCIAILFTGVLLGSKL